MIGIRAALSAAASRRRSDGDPAQGIPRTALPPARALTALAVAFALAMGQVPTAALAAELGVDPVAATDVEATDTAAGSSDGIDASGEAPADTADDASSDAATADGTDGDAVESDAADPQDDPAGTSSQEDAATADRAAGEEASDPSADETAPAEEQKIAASAAIIGPGSDGDDVSWFPDTSFRLESGSTAADVLERALEQAGLTADYGESDYGWYLNTITSPYTGEVLGWDQPSGHYWQVFVNGKASEVGAGSVELKDGDSVALYYSAYGDPLPTGDLPQSLSVTAAVIGPDSHGISAAWAEDRAWTVEEGETAADLTVRVLADAGLTADYGEGTYGWYLNTITSPYTDEVLGWDEASGRYWQLFVNGEPSEVGAGSVDLKEGDRVVWAYAAYGAEEPVPGEPDAGAERPDYDSDWTGFGNGGGTTLVGVPTPSESAEQKWAVDLKKPGEYYVSAGDPMIVNGDIYVTSSTELIRIDGDTGEVLDRVSTGGRTTYFSRPVYADGVIIIPSDDGSIAAFTADTLTCVWRTAALGAPSTGGRYQANSTLTVVNGCVIAGFEAGAGAFGTASAGALVCVRISDGKVMWVNTSVKEGDSTGEGYYWAGAAVSGDEIVIGDDGGKVQLIDASTGDVLSSVQVGMPCRSTIVAAGTEDGDEVFLAVGQSPATLFKIVREGDTLRIAGQVEFGSSSTSTPAVADGVVYVGGLNGSYNGILAVIDLGTMTVSDTFVTDVRGEVKSSPLVSVQGDGTYVYFTANSRPGGVYRYSLSTGEATLLFTPDTAQQNYCTASVIADAEGNLYYTNDSGHLFCISAAAGYTVIYDTQGGSSVAASHPVQGGKLLKPADPEREGYRFTGWYTDAACTVAWDFDDPVNADMTLYAGWEPVSEDTPPVTPGGGTGTGSGGSTGSGQGTVPAGARPVATGTVPAGATPLSTAAAGADAGQDAAVADEADGSASDGTSAAGAASRSVVASAEDAAESAQTGAPMALAGVVVGVIGLVAIAAYLLISRRRDSEGGR